jgi:hypothetical protein
MGARVVGVVLPQEVRIGLIGEKIAHQPRVTRKVERGLKNVQ